MPLSSGHRRAVGVLAVGLLGFVGITGCGFQPSPATAQATTGHNAQNSASSLTFWTEPQAGFTPWRQALAQATTGVEVNQYLLTDRTYIQTLIQIADRGIPVRVILDHAPYDDPGAPAQEADAFAGTPVQLHWAPARFTGAYAFDHAKYLVVNPGTSHALAILGSANGTWSAFAGYNAEDVIEATEPALTTALSQVFAADWAHRPAGAAPRQTLVLSPGSDVAINTLLAANVAHPLAVMTEELGDDPDAYHALENAGSQARVLVPPEALTSPTAQDWLGQLRAAGVQVRTLRQPYLHAKLIVTATQTFVGSQNLSWTAMQTNREVGVITANSTIHAQALAWFNQLWSAATPAS